MKRGTIRFLKLAIYCVGIFALGLCIFGLPSLAQRAAEMYPEFSHLKYPVLGGIYLTAIPFYYALYQAIKLLGYIGNKNAFSDLALVSLTGIKYSALVITGIYIAGMIILGIQGALHPGVFIMGLIIGFAAVTISLFATVLHELFASALAIKSENDLTI